MPITEVTASTPAGAISFANRLRRFAVKTPTRFVGIDIGLPSVRIATLQPSRCAQWDPASPMASLCWHSTNHVELGCDGYTAMTPELIDEIIESLRARLPRCVDGDCNAAVLSLPQPWIHYQTCAGESLSESQRQCDAMFQASAFRSSAHLSHWPTSAGSTNHVVAAASESTACAIAEAISSLGYSVQSILPHGVALLRAAAALTTVAPDCVVILSRVDGVVAISSDGPCGVTRLLPSCPRELAFSDDIDALRQWVDVVAEEIDATMRYAARHSNSTDAESILMICGDLASIPGMDMALANRLGRPVATWCFAVAERNSSDQVEFERRAGHSDDAANAVALSLAFAAAEMSMGAVS